MYTKIAQAIAEIIAQNRKLVDYAYQSNGGYEGWLQVELANYLHAKSYKVVREAQYPNGINLYCDLVVNDVPVELKVDTHQHGDPWALYDDIVKMGSYLNSGTYGYAVRISKGGAGLPPVTPVTVKGSAIYDVVMVPAGAAIPHTQRKFDENTYYITIVKVQA